MEGCGGLEKNCFLTVSSLGAFALGGCGGLERTDFLTTWEDDGLEETDFGFYVGRVWPS